MAAIEKAPATELEASKHADLKTITGFLISIDLSKRRLIVQLNDKKNQLLAFAPSLEIAPFLLGQLVTVKLQEKAEGERLVQHIRLAA